MHTVNFYSLKHIEDGRGSVMHFLKSKDAYFKKFGECYFSWVNPGVIKGWYKNKSITSLMTSPTANLQIVIYDNKDLTVIKINKENYGLVKIPPGIWYSFKSIDDNPALVANLIDEEHDPVDKEVLPVDTSAIPYDWLSKTQNAV